jgi:hypothetical protein
MWWTGCILLGFDLGEHSAGEHRLEYVTNGCRENCVTAMKEFVAKSEGAPGWAKHL